jgi:hypothetical protein
MTVVAHSPAGPEMGEMPSARAYERLLLLYPRSFRDRFGDEMRQVFADLIVHHADGRPAVAWLRVVKDLVASVTRERTNQLVGAGGRGPGAFLVLAMLIAIGATGRLGAALYLLPLVILPTLGLTQLARALSIRRTTGAVSARRVLVGLASLVGSAAWVVAMGEDRGWLIGVSVILSVICGVILGAIWAIRTLVDLRRDRVHGKGRRRAVVVLVMGVLVLGGLVGAGYNSYRKSQPPPGDHSVTNASAESEALWESAYRGDVAEVTRLVAICADPFVHFSGHGQMDFRARSVADWKMGGWGNRHPVADASKPRYRQVVALLHDAEDTWRARCGGKAPSP